MRRKGIMTETLIILAKYLEEKAAAIRNLARGD